LVANYTQKHGQDTDKLSIEVHKLGTLKESSPYMLNIFSQ